MKLITRNNYEAFMLDYVEGNLSPELIAELMLFLENNPDLKTELEDYEHVQLIPENYSLSNKSALKKISTEVTLENYENVIIADLELENTPETSVLLQLFLESNPDKKDDYDAYMKTKLVAPVVYYNDKKSLKKKEEKIIPMYWWYTSAAAIIILLFLMKGITNKEEQQVLPIAKESKEHYNPINDLDVDEKEIVEKSEEKLVAFEEKKLAPIKNIDNAILESPIEKSKMEEKSDDLVAKESEEKNISIHDTLPVRLIEENIEEEEIIYANNVKITYEDNEHEKTMTTFQRMGQFLTKPLKKTFLTQDRDENGEVVAYAINVGGISLVRNKRKK